MVRTVAMAWPKPMMMIVVMLLLLIDHTNAGTLIDQRLLFTMRGTRVFGPLSGTGQGCLLVLALALTPFYRAAQPERLLDKGRA